MKVWTRSFDRRRQDILVHWPPKLWRDHHVNPLSYELGIWWTWRFGMEYFWTMKVPLGPFHSSGVRYLQISFRTARSFHQAEVLSRPTGRPTRHATKFFIQWHESGKLWIVIFLFYNSALASTERRGLKSHQSHRAHVISPPAYLGRYLEKGKAWCDKR